MFAACQQISTSTGIWHLRTRIPDYRDCFFIRLEICEWKSSMNIIRVHGSWFYVFLVSNTPIWTGIYDHHLVSSAGDCISCTRRSKEQKMSALLGGSFWGFSRVRIPGGNDQKLKNEKRNQCHIYHFFVWLTLHTGISHCWGRPAAGAEALPKHPEAW